MKAALIDNWTIERIVDQFDDSLMNSSLEFQVLVAALVLWDNVCYLDNGYSGWWNDAVENRKELDVLKMLTPIQDVGREEVKNKAAKEYISIYSQNYLEIVAKGALEYLYISDEKDMCYIPFDKRAAFITENDLFKKIHQYYTRMDTVTVIDEEIANYYSALNKALNRTQFEINANCIFDYVRKNAGSSSEMVGGINDLKKKKMVMVFKQWVEKMENEILNEKNFDKPSYVITQYIEELEDIKDMQKSDINTSISVGLPFATIGVNISIPIMKKAKPNLVFPAFLYNNAIGRNVKIK